MSRSRKRSVARRRRASRSASGTRLWCRSTARAPSSLRYDAFVLVDTGDLDRLADDVAATLSSTI